MERTICYTELLGRLTEKYKLKHNVKMKSTIFIRVNNAIKDQECLNRKSLDCNWLKEYTKEFASVVVSA